MRRNPGAAGSLIATASATPVVHGKNSLTGGKLKACQVKENVIKNRLTQLVRFVANMVGKFDAIALRVENFYTTKVLAKGKSLSNYDAFVGDIVAKKVLVQTALEKAETDTKNFNCTGGDPKGLLNQYRLDMQAVKRALANYRTSIKNLIVAVHTLIGNTGSPESTGAPVATATPVVTATPTPTVSPTAIPTATPTEEPTASPTP